MRGRGLGWKLFHGIVQKLLGGALCSQAKPISEEEVQQLIGSRRFQTVLGETSFSVLILFKEPDGRHRRQSCEMRAGALKIFCVACIRRSVMRL